MSTQLITNLSSGSISDSSLTFIGDPSTGALTQTSYHAAKDYFTNGITGSSSLSASFYNVKNYGLKGDNSTDNTSALTSLIASVPDGSTIYFPGGNSGYLFNSTVTINKNIQMKGDGMGSFNVFSVQNSKISSGTLINFTSTSSNLFYWTTSSTNDYPVRSIEDMTIANTGVGTPVSGCSAIYMDNNSQEWTLRNVEIIDFYIQVSVKAGFYWLIDNCRFNAPAKYCLQIGNNLDSDIGDWAISNTIFTSGTVSGSGTAGIYWKAGGGGKIVNTKWNSSAASIYADNFDYCITADFSDGPTSDFQCTNCSFENYKISAVKVVNNSGGLFSHWLMSNFQCAPVTNAGTAKSAIDITGISLVTLDNFAGRNYLGAISYPFITLTGVTGGSIGQGQIADFTSMYSFVNCSGVSVGVLPVSNVNNSVLVGSLGLQSTGVNSSLLNENITYVNGTGYVLTNTGYGENLFLGAGEGLFEFTAASATSGSVVTMKIPFRTNANGVGLGSDIQNGDLRQASLVVSGSNVQYRVPCLLTGSKTTGASLNLQSGSAPTSPNTGDIWLDPTGSLKVFINGVTKTFTLS